MSSKHPHHWGGVSPSSRTKPNIQPKLQGMHACIRIAKSKSFKKLSVAIIYQINVYCVQKFQYPSYNYLGDFWRQLVALDFNWRYQSKSGYIKTHNFLVVLPLIRNEPICVALSHRWHLRKQNSKKVQWGWSLLQVTFGFKSAQSCFRSRFTFRHTGSKTPGFPFP